MPRDVLRMPTLNSLYNLVTQSCSIPRGPTYETILMPHVLDPEISVGVKRSFCLCGGRSRRLDMEGPLQASFA